jgi:hypothetical protein
VDGAGSAASGGCECLPSSLVVRTAEGWRASGVAGELPPALCACPRKIPPFFRPVKPASLGQICLLWFAGWWREARDRGNLWPAVATTLATLLAPCPSLEAALRSLVSSPPSPLPGVKTLFPRVGVGGIAMAFPSWRLRLRIAGVVGGFRLVVVVLGSAFSPLSTLCLARLMLLFAGLRGAPAPSSLRPPHGGAEAADGARRELSVAVADLPTSMLFGCSYSGLLLGELLCLPTAALFGPGREGRVPLRSQRP